MLELIKYVVEQFAEKKGEIEYKVEEKENAIEVTVLLAESDMGKVIDGTVNDARQTVTNGNENYGYFNMSYTNNSPEYDDFAPGESYLQ
ncbi:MAG: KH domain-containing protein, partial [Clostridia bacterium]|nr:KH domain-containing protein [Clostridia bacterium]